MPEFRTSGSFADESPRVAWIQPRDSWQALHLLHSGVFTWNGYSVPIEPHDIFIVPPGSRCTVERTGDKSDFVYNYFGFVPAEGTRDTVALPLRTSLGKAGEQWNLEFRKGLSRLQFSRTSVHVVAWSVLWSVAVDEHHATRSVYVEQAEQIIEENLSRPLRIADLAATVQISQSQLTRLFVHEHGRTPLQYLHERRAQRAHRLLTIGTIPVKQVAVECGVPNLHQFNRFVREKFGESPRALRKSRGHVDVFRVGKYSEGQQPDAEDEE